MRECDLRAIYLEWERDAAGRYSPELLELLNVSGCIVTIDTLGCQTAIAQKIRDSGADYILQVKDNQSKLKEDLINWFAYGDDQNFAAIQMDYHRTICKTSGRIETRQCWVVTDPVAFEYIRHYDGWADLNSIVRVHRQVQHRERLTQQTAYYISSLTASAQRLLEATRHHWAIENSFHWVLDVVFDEDRSRIRTGYSDQNMAVLRAITLNLLKHDPDFMLQLLTQV